MSLPTQKGFLELRKVIWRRARRLVTPVAKTIATSYKGGLDVFPSHFDWGGKAYTMQEPSAFASCKKITTARGVAAVLFDMIDQGAMDRFATLIIGLSCAGKILPEEEAWLAYDEDCSEADAWSETDAEESDSDASRER